MKKKALSLALALALCLCLGAPALAAGSDFVIENGVLTEYTGSGGIVTIPSSVTSIGDEAFCGCDSLTSVTIPSSVTNIGGSAFSGCNWLTSVTIPSSVTSIGDEAFYGCRLASVTIPNSVTNIGYAVFADTALTSITIPNSVASIGDYAFADCSILTSVSIPNSVTSIGYGAFSNSGLKSVTIPVGVTSIGEAAFSDCDSLTAIQVDASNQSFCSVGGVLFSKDMKTLIAYPCEKQGAYSIPSSVTRLGDEAFFGCNGLTSVTIPGSVTSIGERTFLNCLRLESVTIPSSVTKIENGTFSTCQNLTSVTIPIGVTRLGDEAFAGCYYLKNVTIPASVTSIGDEAFEHCPSLTDVYYGGTEAQWKRIKISDNNDPLLDAIIHYNSTGPAARPPASADFPPTINFSDVPTNVWYANPVAWAVENGITTGTGATTFSPNKACTNAEIITFLYRANNSPKVSTILPFTPKNSWATDALKWAYSQGIIDADFDEQTPCTRYTTVDYFWKAFGTPIVQAATQFSDISNYSGSPIAWAVQNDIVYGTSTTTFSPDVTCDRATIVTLLQRAYGK